MASENTFICPHCGLPVDVNHLLGERCEEVKDGKLERDRSWLNGSASGAEGGGDDSSV